MPKRFVSTGLVGLTAVLLMAVAVIAQTSGGGFLNGGDLGVGIVDATPGQSGGGGGGGGGGGSGGGGGGGGPAPECTAAVQDSYSGDVTQNVTGPVRYTPVSQALADGLNNPASAGHGMILAAKPSPDAQGSWYQKWCGAGLAGYLWVPQGSSPAAVAPPPPAPPTAAEVRDLTPLPVPSFGVSPTGTGLTGLETWLWDSNGAAPVTASATIRGYSVNATATPGQWRWDMSGGRRNPSPIVTSSRPGTPEDPAGRYTYETPGDYTLTLTVTWSGSYTYSGNGVAAQTRPLGTSDRTSTRGYDVVEVRPVLQSG